MPDRSSLLAVRQLESGYWHIRGQGPCNWAQPPLWPCPDSDVLEESFFGEAAESFRRAVRAENDRLLEAGYA